MAAHLCGKPLVALSMDLRQHESAHAPYLLFACLSGIPLSWRHTRRLRSCSYRSTLLVLRFSQESVERSACCTHSSSISANSRHSLNLSFLPYRVCLHLTSLPSLPFYSHFISLLLLFKLFPTFFFLIRKKL